MSDRRSQLQSIIERHAKQLLEEIREEVLREVRAALGVNDAERVPISARQAPRGADAKLAEPSGARRTYRELVRQSEQVLAAIRERPGSTMEELREHLGVGRTVLTLPIQKLFEDGKLRKTGVKRSTKYFARYVATPPRTPPRVLAEKRTARDVHASREPGKEPERPSRALLRLALAASSPILPARAGLDTR
jgi:hypothetical protein